MLQINTWTATRSNQSILKEISPEYSLERLMLKLQYFGHQMQRTDSLEKTLMLGKEKGMTEDEMVGWHYQFNGHEFEQGLGVGDGPGSLVCCSPWGHKESDMTEWLNWTLEFSVNFAGGLTLYTGLTAFPLNGEFCQDRTQLLQPQDHQHTWKGEWKWLSRVWFFATPMDYTVLGILQARILEWVVFPFSSGMFLTQGSN